ncbi:MAG: thiol reductase thioredoxin [Prevotellaceae bacterium]|jgi:thioredoxin 1|nr:thiol reductase thioredoxin [Prevotellaceae bacterium]
MNNVTDSTYRDILKENAVCVFDFGAAWCGPCKKLSPIMDELAENYSGKAFIGKIDVDENPEMTEEFGIRNVPTVLFFKNGELLKDKVANSKQALDEKIASLLN